MNIRYVINLLGAVLLVLAGAQLIPLIWSIRLGDTAAMAGFAAGTVIVAAIGLAMRLAGSSQGDLFRRDGVLIVVGSWILASVAGAIPYLVSGVLPNPVDALFESASGFTTTGASVMQNIEAAGHPILFWRSFTQWLGGIGIVVLFVALLAELGPGARFLFKLEVPGPKAEVLHAHVRDTAAALARIYLAITLAETFCLLVCGLSLFDSLTHTFATVSTGGFSPYAASVGAFGPTAQAVILVFMLASGVNFSLYLLASRRKDFTAFRDVELMVYLGIVIGVSISIVAAVADSENLFAGTVILDTLFSVVSIVTTTGFATADFNEWPATPRMILVGLMVTGGCAGSTAGGLKIVRAIIGWRAAMREVRLTFSPNSVIAIALGRNAVPDESVRSVVALLVLWGLAWGLGAVLLSIGDVDFVTAATASIATLSNIGPGLGSVGPTGDYAFFASWQKLLMIALMWLGRLEFFALLAFFHVRFWRS